MNHGLIEKPLFVYTPVADSWAYRCLWVWLVSRQKCEVGRLSVVLKGGVVAVPRKQKQHTSRINVHLNVGVTRSTKHPPYWSSCYMYCHHMAPNLVA